MAFLRWFGRNISTMLLAFILAVLVWGSAISAADPTQYRTFEIPIEIIGKDAGTEIMNEISVLLDVTLYAPISILDDLNTENNDLRAWVDLSGVPRGTHNLEVQFALPMDIGPLRLEDVSPKFVEVTLEELVSKLLPIQKDIQGELALGYELGDVNWSHDEVLVSGRLADVETVISIEALVDVTGATQDVAATLTLFPLDENGRLITGITLTPNQVNVTQEITLQENYRNMVVKAVTTGAVANGYRQIEIKVIPPNVLAFSSDAALIEQLPGYIETEELDITGAAEDIDTILALNLPEGVSVIGDPNVRLQVGIVANEVSSNISRSVEIIGIMPRLTAIVSPDILDIILFGPVPLLEALTDVDVRVVVDLTGLGEGVYQLTPDVIILSDQIQLQVISPETVEVLITLDELGTPTPTPAP
jgi:YbbR domain-containing protein